MTRIVFLDRGTIGPAVQLTRPSFPHEWTEYPSTRDEEVVERLAGAQIAITNKVAIRQRHLEQLPALKLVAVAATGCDVIDLDACRERGIPVRNVQGYAVSTVPEHTFALILALRRSILSYRNEVLAGAWEKSGQFCFFSHSIGDLAGTTLGIIGEGAIGQSVARIGQAFGMQTLFAAHKGVDGMGPLYTPFDEVIACSDVITLHCPLTPQTRGLIGIEEFRRMRRKPLLINTARGGLVVEKDLVTALDEGLIAGAGFDCLTSEPPAADHLLRAVWGRPNVIVTPHVAWASENAMKTLWEQVVRNVETYAESQQWRH